MMFPRCSAITNALVSSSASSSSSSSSSPSSLPPPNPSDNLFYWAALSLLYLIRNPSSHSPAPPLPLSLSFRPKPRNNYIMSGGRGGGGVQARTTTTTKVASATTRALAFSTPESLSDWLKPRLPPGSFASWGVKPGTKTVHNLWLELSQGETSLLQPHIPDSSVPPQQQQPQPGSVEEEEEELGSSILIPPLRTVHVATVRIRNPSGGLLVESHQLLSDGSIRARFRPLSEKMKPGESVEDAASRAVQEELGGGRVRIVPGSYEMKVEDRASASYPGLPARYVLHSVDAEVEGLPEEEEFSTDEHGEGCEVGVAEKAVFVRRHFWKWVYDDGDEGSSLPVA